MDAYGPQQDDDQGGDADILESVRVEETPDTIVIFTTGRKIIIKESRQEVKNLVKSYRKDIFAD